MHLIFELVYYRDRLRVSAGVGYAPPPTPLQGLSTPVKRQSSTRREPLQIRCQSIANPVSMKHQSGPILCQSSANLSPIHGHQGNGNLMSMHSHSCANQVPSHIGANPFQSNKGMPNQCGSNPLQINRKMTKNDQSIIQFNQTPIHLNPMSIQWPFPNPVCLHHQPYVNPLPIFQSMTNP